MDVSPSVASADIRYQGKAVNDENWIRGFLAGRETGVLGLTDGEEPHLVTQLFVCEDESIYVHGASDGRAYDLVSSTDEPQSCFTTSEIGRFIPLTSR
jgi:uncharacterized protein